MARLKAHNPQKARLKSVGYRGDPTGTIEIIENGIIDVKAYAYADVQVPDPPLMDKTITKNGKYKASDDDVYGFREVEVALPFDTAEVTPSTVEQNVTPRQGFEALESVKVNPTPLEELVVTPTTEQQVITPTAPNIGLSSVTVEATPPPPTLITKQITENGTYAATDDNADGYSEVTVNVPDASVATLDALINKSITRIESNVLTIGANAFNSCRQLQTAVFPSVKRIGNNGFLSCVSLKTIYFPVAEWLGITAFQACSQLSKAVFPLVETINNNCFVECTALTTLVLNSRATALNAHIIPSQTIVYVENADLEWYSTATNWSAIYADGRIKSVDELPEEEEEA